MNDIIGSYPTGTSVGGVGRGMKLKSAVDNKISLSSLLMSKKSERAQSLSMSSSTIPSPKNGNADDIDNSEISISDEPKVIDNCRPPNNINCPKTENTLQVNEYQKKNIDLKALKRPCIRFV